jgi:DNA-directed RNA polymerase specialized sigma24 family protein
MHMPSRIATLRPGRPDDEARLVAALRTGDEAAFAFLVRQHHGSLVRVAMSYARDRASRRTPAGNARGRDARQGAAARLEAAIAELPPVQAQVISLRDVQGWSSEEVCDLLSITPANQRVLLHRARTKVRAALAEYLEAGEGREAGDFTDATAGEARPPSL